MTRRLVHIAEADLTRATGMGRVGWHWRDEAQARGIAFEQIGQGNVIPSKELYAENVHVPMFLLHPRRLGLPTRISQLGSLNDIMPTVLAILGFEEQDRDGMSLLSDAPARLVFSMTDWGPGQLALRDRQYLYVLSRTGRELLFDRLADPLEQTNLLTSRPQVAAGFRARLTTVK